jgi:CubicO group peptidase (beta-lactamase class C family)
MTQITKACQRKTRQLLSLVFTFTGNELGRVPMRALSDKDFPALAREVSLELENWPGEPSLAVIGEDGILGFKDSGRVYRLASVTKLLTALTVLSAADEGVISLEDEAGPPGSSLLHLLSHASGVGFADEQVRAPAGGRRIYSNTGIDLAADYLAGRTGKDFRDEMRIRVLEPLGMHETKLTGPPSKGGEGTITDTARLARELLKPTIFPQARIDVLSSLAYPGIGGFLPGFGYHTENDWGAGAEVRGHKSPHWTSPDNSPATFGHFGMSGSFLWVDREAGLACTALSTIEFGDWAPIAWPDTSTAVLRAYRKTMQAGMRNSGIRSNSAPR